MATELEKFGLLGWAILLMASLAVQPKPFSIFVYFIGLAGFVTHAVALRESRAGA